VDWGAGAVESDQNEGAGVDVRGEVGRWGVGVGTRRDEGRAVQANAEAVGDIGEDEALATCDAAEESEVKGLVCDAVRSAGGLDDAPARGRSQVNGVA
jgi:hypothetical protein